MRASKNRAINNSLDINSKYFINSDKKCTVKPYFSLVTDTTFSPDNFLRFRNFLLDRIRQLIMTIDIKFDINREAAKYQHYHQVKFGKKNILPMEKSYQLMKVK